MSATKKTKETEKLAGCKEDEERMLVRKRRFEGRKEARKEGRKKGSKEGRKVEKEERNEREGRKKEMELKK